MAAVPRHVRGAVPGGQLELAAVGELGPDPALDHVRELLMWLWDVVLHPRERRERHQDRLHRVQALGHEDLDVDRLRGVVQQWPSSARTMIGSGWRGSGTSSARRSSYSCREPGQAADR